MDASQFFAALEEIFVAPKGSISADSKVEDIGQVDSMAMLEIQALADEQFQRRVEPEQVADCVSVRDLATLVGLDLRS